MQNKCDRFIELLNKIQEKKKGDDIQQYFADVAKYLFEHVAIEAGGKTFTFAEVEFYYYKEGDFEGPLIHVREMWVNSSGTIAVWTSALRVARKRSTSVVSLLEASKMKMKSLLDLCAVLM